MENKAIFKFNSARLALLCSNCYVIIKTGKDFTKEEGKALKGEIHLPPQYCDKCGSGKNITEKTKFATECANAAASKSKYESYTQAWNNVWKTVFKEAFSTPEKYKTDLL